MKKLKLDSSPIVNPLTVVWQSSHSRNPLARTQRYGRSRQ
jgi:hypothetical protein